MKLLFIQETDWLRRNNHQQHHLAEMLSLRGHSIRVIDYEFSWRTQGKKELRSGRQVFENVSKIHRNAGVTVVRPGIVKLPLVEYASLFFSHKREIDRQVSEFKPDLIVGWGILNTCHGVRAAIKAGIPFFYYWIDALDKLIPLKPFRSVGRLFESKTLARSDRVLAINESLKDYVSRLGASPSHTHILRAGIDTGRFDPDSVSPQAVREQYKLNEHDRVLFFMGWLYHFSGLKEVASTLANSADSNLKLLIVGEGDAYAELCQIRDRLNLHDRLILTGKKPYQEIPAFVAASDICLLPAYPTEDIMQDIVPIKMYEYMAMGKPVIVTRLPGLIKEFGESSGVVYVDKPEDVIDKAIDLLKQADIKELGLRARRFAEANSWDKITDEFEKIMEEAIREKSNERNLSGKI